MTHSGDFSSDQAERWSEIDDFPGYSISTWGRVKNETTGECITPTRKPNGLVMIGLMQYDEERGRPVQRKRSMPLLVARAFVPQKNETYDTPIHLNGDRSDFNYTNLLWRPLWYARKYMKQFDTNEPAFDYPIEDVETGEVYTNTRHASTTFGIVDSEIRLSMLNNTYVWPTGQVFREAINR